MAKVKRRQIQRRDRNGQIEEKSGLVARVGNVKRENRRRKRKENGKHTGANVKITDPVGERNRVASERDGRFQRQVFECKQHRDDRGRRYVHERGGCARLGAGDLSMGSERISGGI